MSGGVAVSGLSTKVAAKLVGSEAKRAGRRAQHSSAVTGFARLGLGARGLVYLLVAGLAASIALGDHNREADRKGALEAIANAPAGRLLLAVLAVGFAGHAVWRVLDAGFGHRDEEGLMRTARRLGSLVVGAVYAVLALSALRAAMGSGGGQGDGQEQHATASLAGLPLGQPLVVVVGLAVIAAGLGVAGWGITQKFLDELDLGGANEATRTAARVLGTAGQVARGVVLLVAGLFLVIAGARSDSGQSKGLDGSLKALASQPYGTVLLLTVAAGLLAFASYSVVELRYRRL